MPQNATPCHKSSKMPSLSRPLCGLNPEFRPTGEVLLSLDSGRGLDLPRLDGSARLAKSPLLLAVEARQHVHEVVDLLFQRKIRDGDPQLIVPAAHEDAMLLPQAFREVPAVDADVEG